VPPSFANAMLYVALLALIATVATAAPILDMFAEPCTGSGAFKADMVGKCYSGGATVLTLGETAVLKVLSYDDSTHSGSMRVDLEGASVVHCGPATFKKSALDGQINSDLSSCGKLHKALASAQYCTDQDTIRLHAKIPDHPNLPGADMMPLLPVTLKPTPCKEAHESMKASKAAP